MNELRNTISTTTIPRTGTLIVIHVVDLPALAAAVRKADGVGEGTDLDLEGAGNYEIVLKRAGKTKRLALLASHGEAQAFVAGAKACADARKRRTKKAAK